MVRQFNCVCLNLLQLNFTAGAPTIYLLFLWLLVFYSIHHGRPVIPLSQSRETQMEEASIKIVDPSVAFCRKKPRKQIWTEAERDSVVFLLFSLRLFLLCDPSPEDP